MMKPQEVPALSKEDAITETEPAVAYYSMPLEEVFETLNVDRMQGLTGDEAKQRLQEVGPNTIPKYRGDFWQVYIAPILNWLITIYIISSFALILIAFFFPSDLNTIGGATVWLAVVAVNAIVAMIQQFRAQKKLEALEQLSAGEARVIRNGKEANISPIDIVPGDIVKLEQGYRIPSDGRIVSSSNLMTEEASLTGESVPVMKNEDAHVSKDSMLTDRLNMVFFGTYVATGMATVITTATGSHTEIGKIQGTLEALNTGDIPLRRKVNVLAKYLGIAAIILMAVSVMWQVVVYPFLSGEPFIFTPQTVSERIGAGITRAMTIMPINIPLLTTIVLLTGVLAMAKRGVIIRDLSAVESLGRVSVICSDKTGTMTKNQMTVKYCWDTKNLFSVRGDGYEPSGHIMLLKGATNSNLADIEEEPVNDVFRWKGLFRLVTCGGIANDSEIVKEEIPDQGTIWIPLGDPTDAALLTLFRKSGIDEPGIKKKYTIVEEFPFESELKRMSKICQDGDKFVAFVKGATEVLLPLCEFSDGADTPSIMTPGLADRVTALANDFASKGYRVISLAYKQMESVPTGNKAREKTESKLIYLGFACIVDPPREGVKEAVRACHSAGINVIMITGDAAATAKTIAKDLGVFTQNSLVVEGHQIHDITNEDFARTNVFARVNPEHKQIIVERYQDQKKVVAMTGDGVNDALALAMSDAGIAMGITGTDVAKEAADIVITDDSFASIVSGVHQGRGLFNKIRMMIYFYVAINLFESIIFFGALFILPSAIEILSQWQQIYLVVTTHSFPGLALVFDRTSPRAMEDKPRDSQEIITKNLGKIMALNVLLMAIGAACVYFLTFTGYLGIVEVTPENMSGFWAVFRPDEPNLFYSIEGPIWILLKATSMLLSVILIVESTLVLLIRRINMPIHKSLREPGTWIFALLLGLIYLAHYLLMYVPEVNQILTMYNLNFYIVPLTAYDWIICILLALPTIIGVELYKWHFRQKEIDL
ncbi:cation-transporting P-type ATPase [Candidatus Thorarchaeota archaeon]|nr:MAG: cation-transporting P-type ATPase [Candidatus Thorarchaeota archaeon]